MANSSSVSAHVPGTALPSGTRCSKVRLVAKPSAPAPIASSTRSHIAAMSSSVGTSSPVASVHERPRSPITW